jgi:purine-binding chemotaxis protein CheW
LREATRLTQVRRVPGAAARVAGLVNVRGEIFCALDARAILGLPPAPPLPGYMLALRGFDQRVGLIVDAIADVITIDPETVEPPPDSPPDRAACITGTTSVYLGHVMVLDVEQVVAA